MQPVAPALRNPARCKSIELVPPMLSAAVLMMNTNGVSTATSRLNGWVAQRTSVIRSSSSAAHLSSCICLIKTRLNC